MQQQQNHRIYTHVSARTIADVRSPADALDISGAGS